MFDLEVIFGGSGSLYYAADRKGRLKSQPIGNFEFRDSHKEILPLDLPISQIWISRLYFDFADMEILLPPEVNLTVWIGQDKKLMTVETDSLLVSTFNKCGELLSDKITNFSPAHYGFFYPTFDRKELNLKIKVRNLLELELVLRKKWDVQIIPEFLPMLEEFEEHFNSSCQKKFRMKRRTRYIVAHRRYIN